MARSITAFGRSSSERRNTPSPIRAGTTRLMRFAAVPDQDRIRLADEVPVASGSQSQGTRLFLNALFEAQCVAGP